MTPRKSSVLHPHIGIVDSSQFQEDILIKKMLQYHHGTLTAKQSCGYFARKVHGNKKGNQHECIVLCLLGIILFCLNSRRCSHTAQEDQLVLIRPTLLPL